MTCTSPSGGTKRAMEEGVGGFCCLSGDGWWAREERNGIHHGATSWSLYENFKEPGDPNSGMLLVASVWGKAHYQGETTETTCRLPLGVPLLGMWWTLVGLQCLPFQGNCFRECSLWSQRVNYEKWYIHSRPVAHCQSFHIPQTWNECPLCVRRSSIPPNVNTNSMYRIMCLKSQILIYLTSDFNTLLILSLPFIPQHCVALKWYLK